MRWNVTFWHLTLRDKQGGVSPHEHRSPPRFDGGVDSDCLQRKRPKKKEKVSTNIDSACANSLLMLAASVMECFFFSVEPANSDM